MVLSPSLQRGEGSGGGVRFLNCVLFIVSILSVKKSGRTVFVCTVNYKIHLQKYVSVTYNITSWETTITPSFKLGVWVIQGILTFTMQRN